MAERFPDHSCHLLGLPGMAILAYLSQEFGQDFLSRGSENMSVTHTNPTYSWSQLADFRARILALGGSSDVGSGAEASTDVDISGRYARYYSVDLPDAPGRTLTFYCSPDKPGEYGTPGHVPCIVLTGCPWGTAAERDTTYRELALSGCRPNDMRNDAALLALVEQARGAAQTAP